MLIVILSIALVAGVGFVRLHDISMFDAFQADTLDLVPAQFKATEVPHPTEALEATAPMAVLGASLPQGSPMGAVGRAKGLLNTSERRL